MGPVIGCTGLEVGLVLHGTGQAGGVDVDQRRNKLAGATFESVAPLAAPLAVQLLRNPPERGLDEIPVIIGFDRNGMGFQVLRECGVVSEIEIIAVSFEIVLELEHTALGAEEELLGQRGAGDATGGVTQVGAQQLGFGQVGLAEHVAGGETVHGVGHWDQRQRRGAVGDGGEICGFLRIGTEQNGVAGGEQGVDIIVASHHVQRVLGDHPCSHLQHETPDFLTHCHIVGFHRIQNSLAGRCVGDELTAGEGGAQSPALRRVFPFGLEEERMATPDVATTFGAGSFKKFRDFGGGGDRVTDDTAAHMTHHMRDGPVAVDDSGHSGEGGRLLRGGGIAVGRRSRVHTCEIDRITGNRHLASMNPARALASRCAAGFTPRIPQVEVAPVGDGRRRRVLRRPM